MKKTIISSIIVLVATLLTPIIIQGQGTTYLSNLGQTSNGNVAVGSDSWLAVAVRTGNNTSGYIFNSVQLRMLDATGTPSGFEAMIYTSNLGGGVGTSIETLTGSLNPAVAGVYTYTAPADLVLSSLSQYFIVLTSGTTVANGAYEWSLSSSIYNRSGGWIGGAPFFSSSDGSSWGGPAFPYPQFALNATAVPEPSVLGLLALGGMGFFWHRRKANVV